MGTRLFKKALGLIFGMSLILLGISFFAARTAVYPWWYKHQLVGERLSDCSDHQKNVNLYCNDPQKDLGLPFKWFETEKVTGWHIGLDPAVSAAKGTVILVHGGGVDRRAMLKHVPYLHEAQLNVLVIDCWNHGLTRGDGRGLSFGLKESESVIAAAEWAAASKLPPPYFVQGTSQGGFTAMLSMARSKIFTAAVAEAPYVSVRKLFEDFPAMVWLPGLSRKLAASFVGLWLGVGLDTLDVSEFAAQIDRPVLLIHGDADVSIPLNHSEKIAQLLKGKSELWVVPRADHEMGWNVAKKAYEKKVIDFYQASVLGREAGK